VVVVIRVVRQATLRATAPTLDLPPQLGLLVEASVVDSAVALQGHALLLATNAAVPITMPAIAKRRP